MLRILLKAGLFAFLSMVASLVFAAIFLPILGGEFAGNAVAISALCPLVIAFPATTYTLWQNSRLTQLHAELRKTHEALQLAHARLSEKARRDVMTGFLNRESFFSLLEGSRRKADRGSLLLIDADFFKRINDGYGHLVGDDALQEIAAAIGRAVRERDIVGRIGGEEFAVLLSGADAAEASIIAERIRREVELVGFMPAQGKTLTLTVSIGGTVCWLDAGVSELMREADRRLYKAKNAGRNRVVFDGDQRWAA